MYMPQIASFPRKLTTCKTSSLIILSAHSGEHPLYDSFCHSSYFREKLKKKTQDSLIWILSEVFALVNFGFVFVVTTLRSLWLILALESKLLDIQTFYKPIVRLVSLKWVVIKLFIPQKWGKCCKSGLLFWTAFISTPLSQALSPSLWWSWKCISQIPNCKEPNWLLLSATIHPEIYHCCCPQTRLPKYCS